MLTKQTSSNSVNNFVIIIVVFLLAGVITMTYGFANNTSFIIYLGVFVTFAASFASITLSIVSHIKG